MCILIYLSWFVFKGCRLGAAGLDAVSVHDQGSPLLLLCISSQPPKAAETEKPRDPGQLERTGQSRALVTQPAASPRQAGEARFSGNLTGLRKGQTHQLLPREGTFRV